VALMAAIGIHGLIQFAVSTRTMEIAIRPTSATRSTSPSGSRSGRSAWRWLRPLLRRRLPAGRGLDHRPHVRIVRNGRFFGGAYLRDADFTADTADFFCLQTMIGF